MNKTWKQTLIKKIEMVAVNFLLKRGYQVAFPMIYFSSGKDKVFTSATYWNGTNTTKD